MSPELIEGAIAFTKDTFMSKYYQNSLSCYFFKYIYFYNSFYLTGIDVYACALTLWEIVHRGDFYGSFF